MTVSDGVNHVTNERVGKQGKVEYPIIILMELK